MWSPRSRYLPLLTLWSTILLCIAPALGADMYIYPTKGQTLEQQAQDKSECHAWAVQQTQFDPMQSSASPSSASAAVPQGGGIRGAGRGAAVGAVGGAIGGDAGKGAAIGAATGALMGRVRQRDQIRQQEAQQQQQQAAYDQQRAEYDRAVRACLTGRGYTDPIGHCDAFFPPLRAQL